jgi:hypothetical protein
MSWQDHDVKVGSNDDLMGVHGDVLFADPLGIRKGKASPAPTQQKPTPNNGGSRKPDTSKNRNYSLDETVGDGLDLDLNLPKHRGAEIRAGSDRLMEEEEDPGPIRAWLGHMFGFGTQCCSMRDRSKDADQAKKAAEIGRPPAPANKPFPAPREKAEPKVDKPAAVKESRPNQGMEDSNSSIRSRNAPPQKDPFLAASPKEDPKRHPGLDALHSFVQSPVPEQRKASPEVQERLPQSPQVPPARNKELESRPQQDSLVSREGAGLKDMPRKWQWPAWTLNTKQASIEVYVVDEESGESRWCEAEPQFRVVDKEGHDAYLCAEYEWDGEFYVQDFGPHHVRKRGQDATVYQLFSYDSEALGTTDMLKDTSKSVRRNMDDTDPFMTSHQRPRDDTGGGVSSWLDKD